MAVFGKGSQPSRLARSDRKRFLSRLPSADQPRLHRGCGPHFPQNHIKRHLDNSATGPLGLSTMADILADQHRESGRLPFACGFKTAAATDLIIVDQALARTFLGASIYNIPAIANFVNAPTRLSQEKPILAFCQERAYGFFQNFILLILARNVFQPVRQNSWEETLDGVGPNRTRRQTASLRVTHDMLLRPATRARRECFTPGIARPACPHTTSLR